MSARDHGARASITAAALAALALVLPSAALILGGNNSGRAAFDSTAYHERFIRAPPRRANHAATQPTNAAPISMLTSRIAVVESAPSCANVATTMW